jgi:hypothetical protein
MTVRHILFAVAAAAPFFLAGGARADDPLMGRVPWNFSYQNRAAVAIAIKNVEDPAGNGNGAGTIVCGGTSGSSGQGSNGSGASAGANSSCIIISNSDGAMVRNDQISDGDQTAISEASANTGSIGAGDRRGDRGAGSGRSGSIDDVAAVLNGHRQGL